jgi:hypothetical protein
MLSTIKWILTIELTDGSIWSVTFDTYPEAVAHATVLPPATLESITIERN